MGGMWLAVAGSRVRREEKYTTVFSRTDMASGALFVLARRQPVVGCVSASPFGGGRFEESVEDSYRRVCALGPWRSRLVDAIAEGKPTVNVKGLDGLDSSPVQGDSPRPPFLAHAPPITTAS